MKKWKCSVCDYIHTGNEPPDKCPICSSDKSLFLEVLEEHAVPVKSEPLKAEDNVVKKPENMLIALTLKHHLHPISVHIPNGILPAAVIFMLIAALFHSTGFEKAAFYNLTFVLIIMPLVLLTGYIEWKNRYQSALTRIFKIKIGCAAVVLLMVAIIVLWRLINPGIAFSASAGRWVFLIFHLVMLGAAGVAGYFGGKLVFGKKHKKS